MKREVEQLRQLITAPTCPECGGLLWRKPCGPKHQAARDAARAIAAPPAGGRPKFGNGRPKAGQA
jgi:hypothetical protein